MIEWQRPCFWLRDFVGPARRGSRDTTNERHWRPARVSTPQWNNPCCFGCSDLCFGIGQNCKDSTYLVRIHAVFNVMIYAWEHNIFATIPDSWELSDRNASRAARIGLRKTGTVGPRRDTLKGDLSDTVCHEMQARLVFHDRLKKLHHKIIFTEWNTSDV